MASAPTLVFPKEVLTPLKGKPDATSLQILQQELYQNARAIPSFLGGGQLGHLGLVMPVQEYLLRPGAQAFHIPVPPGLIPAQAGNATAAQLFEVKRVHDYNSLVFVTYQSVRNALTNQILAAVEPTYLLELCDVDFGFVDVLPSTMLTHLKTTYGQLSGLEIERNRARLSAAWDPTSPIESLWARIMEIRRIAAVAGQPIDDRAVIALVLPMFERTGLFMHAVNFWNSLENNEQTYAFFGTHFTRANKLRVTNLTAGDLNYADANIATTAPSALAAVTPPRKNDIGSTTRMTTPVGAIAENTQMFYCWSHGLSTQSRHTSASCRQPKPGHKKEATIFNRFGGCNTFRTREDQVSRDTPNA